MAAMHGRAFVVVNATTAFEPFSPLGCKLRAFTQNLKSQGSCHQDLNMEGLRKMGWDMGTVAGQQMSTSRTGSYTAQPLLILPWPLGCKRAHQNIDATCQAEGRQFVPLVAEACGGGWGPAAAALTWKRLAQAVAGHTGEAVSVLFERLQQTLALTLQRENARAPLRRPHWR